MTNYQEELNQAVAPTRFLVVSNLIRYTHDKSFELSNVPECISSFEAPSVLAARWIVQEGGQTFE
jgi:hypothetical protein